MNFIRLLVKELNMMNWHSQGSIYGAAAMIHFLDTDEGKEIAKKKSRSHRYKRNSNNSTWLWEIR